MLTACSPRHRGRPRVRLHLQRKGPREGGRPALLLGLVVQRMTASLAQSPGRCWLSVNSTANIGKHLAIVHEYREGCAYASCSCELDDTGAGRVDFPALCAAPPSYVAIRGHGREHVVPRTQGESDHVATAWFDRGALLKAAQAHSWRVISRRPAVLGSSLQAEFVSLQWIAHWHTAYWCQAGKPLRYTGPLPRQPCTLWAWQPHDVGLPYLCLCSM
jgi:hypothetical protein